MRLLSSVFGIPSSLIRENFISVFTSSFSMPRIHLVFIFALVLGHFGNNTNPVGTVPFSLVQSFTHQAYALSSSVLMSSDLSVLGGEYVSVFTGDLSRKGTSFDVLGLTDSLKVVRINTSSYSAEVISNHTWFHRPFVKYARQAVREHQLTLVSNLLWVSVPVELPPNPAAYWVNGDALREQINNARHDVTSVVTSENWIVGNRFRSDRLSERAATPFPIPQTIVHQGEV